MFRKIKIKNNNVYCAEYDEMFKECSEWAYKTAKSKLDYTLDLWFNKRTPLEKFQNIFYGDLAKNLVKQFIVKYTNANVVEYDLVRTDNFKDHDLYDLKIGNEIMEIKSSCEKYSNDIKRLIDERRIIVNVKEQQTVSDYVVQVLFVPKNLSFFKKEIINNDKNHLTDKIIEKNYIEQANALQYGEVKAYICGWINRNQEQQSINNATTQRNERFKIFRKKNKAYKKTYCNYLLKDTNDLDDLINLIKDYTEINS